jgi:hypothetical protein
MKVQERLGWQFFGYNCILIRCYLVAGRIDMLPVSSTEPLDIIAKPLFWSMVSILDRVRANLQVACAR